jgi:hypothetical protein
MSMSSAKVSQNSNPAQLAERRLICRPFALPARLLLEMSRYLETMMATAARVEKYWVTEAVRHWISSSCGQWNIPGQRRWRRG